MVRQVQHVPLGLLQLPLQLGAQVLHRDDLLGPVGSVVVVQLGQLIFQGGQLVSLAVQQGPVVQLHQLPAQLVRLGCQLLTARPQAVKVHGGQPVDHLLLLVHPGGNGIPRPTQTLPLGGQLLLVVVQGQLPHGLRQLGKLGLPRQDVPVLRDAAHLKEDLPAALPVHPFAEPGHVGEHAEQLLTHQLAHSALELVFLHRHLVHKVFAGVAVIAGLGAPPLGGPLLIVGLLQGDLSAAGGEAGGDRTHRPVVLHLPVRAQGLDLKVPPSTAVFAEQQPGQRVIDSGLARGVVAVDVGGLSVQLQIQRLAALKPADLQA